jgi:hypothetical protein
MQPYGTPGTPDNPYPNVLTIDIPRQWERTGCPKNKCPKNGPVGPNLWARTGCRYDIATNRAQCETGSCADQYDCSSTGFSQFGFTSSRLPSTTMWAPQSARAGCRRGRGAPSPPAWRALRHLYKRSKRWRARWREIRAASRVWPRQVTRQPNPPRCSCPAWRHSPLLQFFRCANEPPAIAECSTPPGRFYGLRGSADTACSCRR